LSTYYKVLVQLLSRSQNGFFIAFCFSRYISAVKFTDTVDWTDNILAILHATSVTSNVSRVFVDPAVIRAPRCCPASLITSTTAAEVTDAWKKRAQQRRPGAVAESTLPAVGNRRQSIPLRRRSGTSYTTLNLATVSRSVGNLATRSD